jgi:hypothetical protein
MINERLYLPNERYYSSDHYSQKVAESLYIVYALSGLDVSVLNST